MASSRVPAGNRAVGKSGGLRVGGPEGVEARHGRRYGEGRFRRAREHPEVPRVGRRARAVVQFTDQGEALGVLDFGQAERKGGQGLDLARPDGER